MLRLYSPLCLCFLATMRWVALILHVFLTQHGALSQVQSNRDYWLWTGTFEIIRQNKPFFLENFLSQAMYHTNSKSISEDSKLFHDTSPALLTSDLWSKPLQANFLKLNVLIRYTTPLLPWLNLDWHSAELEIFYCKIQKRNKLSITC